MTTALKIARGLLEDEDAFDPASEAMRLTTHPNSALSVRPEGVYWAVNLASDPDPQHWIARIYHDDLDNAPDNINRAYWEANPWTVISTYGRGDGAFPSFEAALASIEQNYAGRNQPMESLDLGDPADEDNPENYTKLDPTSKQPEQERLEFDLRSRLHQYYPDVKTHVTKLSNTLHRWTVTCQRDMSQKMPRRSSDWSTAILNCFIQWNFDDNARMDINSLKHYGNFRNVIVFIFTTTEDKITESEEEDDAASLEDIVDKLDWDRDLLVALQEFHPYGVSYTVFGIKNMALIHATTYFEPNRDNFAARFRDFTLNWLKSNRIMPVETTRLQGWQTRKPAGSGMVEWVIYLSINMPVDMHDKHPDWPTGEANAGKLGEAGVSA